MAAIAAMAAFGGRRYWYDLAPGLAFFCSRRAAVYRNCNSTMETGDCMSIVFRVGETG